MTDEELIKQYRDQQAALNGGCSDGYCVIAKPVGMHTNGGCSCLSNLDFLGRQRVGVMLRTAQAMADRIEQLAGDYAGACNEAADCYIKQCAAEAKLAECEARLSKAVEALQGVVPYWDKTNPLRTADIRDRYRYNFDYVCAVLAELEKPE